MLIAGITYKQADGEWTSYLNGSAIIERYPTPSYWKGASHYHRGETPDGRANSRGFRVTFSSKKPSKAIFYLLDDN